MDLHSPLWGAAALWVVSALVQTMPKPLPMERFYGWLYAFAQLLGANLNLLSKGNGRDFPVKPGILDHGGSE